MTLPWILAQFVVCTAVILYAGVRLSRYGDIIAEKTGLGGAWIGVALLATVTSLPELITGASSVLLFDVPDIAAGDAIGSCMFNLVILAFLDVRNPTPLSARIHQGHVLSASFGILQLGLVTLAMLAGARAIVIGWVGAHSIVFVAVYLFAMRTIFAFERKRMRDVAEEMTGEIRYGEITLRRTAVFFVVSAAALVAAAAYLPPFAERFAAAAGLSESFVGSILVAVSTSLPEIAVSIAPIRPDELASVRPQLSIDDQRVEHTLATGWLQPEQAGRLRNRQAQAGHLVVFGSDAGVHCAVVFDLARAHQRAL